MKTNNKYFSQEFSNFLKELEENNNKEWFNGNKKRYQEYVALPFNAFIEKILNAIKRQDSTIDIELSEAVFRINRDLRFTKDKSPYKIFKSALISPKGRKSKEEPGFYLEMGAAYIKIACGCFKLSPVQLRKIERNIAQIASISGNPTFISYWGGLIKSKNSLTFETLLPSKLLTSDDLDVQMLTYWRTMKPIVDVFKEILQKEGVAQ